MGVDWHRKRFKASLTVPDGGSAEERLVAWQQPAIGSHYAGSLDVPKAMAQ
jgi:hypothetical protein